MPQELNIILNITRQPILGEILATLGELPKTNVQNFASLPAEQTNQKQGALANIIIIDDHPEETDVFERLSLTQKSFPKAAIFVISTDKRPEHIVSLMKAGATEYLCNPLNVINLKDAVEEIRIKQANAGQITRGTVCSFVSSKGGLGSTVIAVNAAAALAKGTRGSVALCDMCLQSGDASVLLDVAPALNIVDLARNSHRFDVGLFRGAMNRHATGLDFLAAPPNPEDSADVNASHVAQILKMASKLYDYTIIDCPSMSLDECTLEIFRASDQIFVITDLSVTAVRNAARLCTLIEKIGIDRSNIAVAINRFIKGSALSVAEVEGILKRPIFWLFPNAFDDIVSSINRGVPLIKHHPGAPFSRNITAFVEKLENPQAHGDYRGVRGTFGKTI